MKHATTHSGNKPADTRTRTGEALHTFRREMQHLDRNALAKQFGVSHVITGAPNSAELRAELDAVDFPIDTPLHVIAATREFSLQHGVFPPALVTTEDEELMTEWCSLLVAKREEIGVRTAQRGLDEHHDVIERMARNGYDPVVIARHLGCRTENITNFLKRHAIPLRVSTQTTLADPTPVKPDAVVTPPPPGPRRRRGPARLAGVPRPRMHLNAGAAEHRVSIQTSLFASQAN